MPRVKLTKSVIDNLAASGKDVVYWDAAWPGFGVKGTPAGRKVFVVLYRTGGAGCRQQDPQGNQDLPALVCRPGGAGSVSGGRHSVADQGGHQRSRVE